MTLLFLHWGAHYEVLLFGEALFHRSVAVGFVAAREVAAFDVGKDPAQGRQVVLAPGRQTDALRQRHVPSPALGHDVMMFDFLIG